jgi:hypothetical protein
MSDLPPLPTKPLRFAVAVEPTGETIDYTANQMREYGELCRKQALEEAASLVDANADRCVASTFVPEKILRSNAEAIRELI